jgi:hypothetical protein
MADIESRLAALERAVESMQREIAEMRPSPRVVEAKPAPPPPPPRPERIEIVRVEPEPPGLDLEPLVGRYGMLALATVLALAAVGTFVGWAIRHGLLGPVPRVVLGLAAATAIGAWGFNLRPREQSFGDSLLGLSLAIVHVCAWAAGPGLHIVPPFMALALSAVASVGLAGYALVHDDEPLWCVGFGGAAIAPFVTSTGQGTAPMLAAYAAAVLIAAGSALGSRPWLIAARVFGASALLFVVGLEMLPRSQHSAELELALPFAVAALGVLPFAHGAVVRPRLRTLGVLAAAAAIRVGLGHGTFAAVAIGLAGAAWLVLVELTDSEPVGTLFDGIGPAGTMAEWIEGALIPCAFVGAVWTALQGDAAAAAAALAAAVLVWFSSRREGELRDAAAFAAFASALIAAIYGARSPAQLQVAVSGLAIAFALLERIIPNRTWRWMPQAVLAIVAFAVLADVTQRPSYQYTPFFTPESAVALLVAIAWVVVARPAAWVFVFFWVHQELAFARSPNVSTLLLVSWYAVTGVGCVGIGRAMAAPRVRHIGLGLGAIAAALALKAAWGLESTGARIGAYLVVAVFLFGIAWWYRQPGPAAEPTQ